MATAINNWYQQYITTKNKQYCLEKIAINNPVNLMAIAIAIAKAINWEKKIAIKAIKRIIKSFRFIT